jgi:hypothetical protein
MRGKHRFRSVRHEVNMGGFRLPYIDIEEKRTRKNGRISRRKIKAS